jgi:STE24 endopeptidase
MEALIVFLFLFFFAAEFLVEFILNELNIRHVQGRRTVAEIPEFFRAELSAEEYDRSAEYTVAKGRFQRWAAIYDGLITLALLFTGVLTFWDRLAGNLAAAVHAGPLGHGVLFCLGVALYFTVARIPLGLYGTFVLEARYGFNQTTWGLYVVDKLKALVLGLVLGVPFLWAVLALMQAAGSYWWVWTFLLVIAFQVLIIVIFPTVIAPWFNKFEPLPQGEFRDRILALADRVGFKTSGIFSMDGSKRSAHSNAYFTGLGKSKRIVLFDTLLEQMSIEQGLAVLAHEMGHYRLKHIQRMLLVQSAFLLVGLFVLSLLLNFAPFFAAFGLAPSHHAALVLFSVISGSATFYLGPLMNALSRKHEYEADRFAATTLNDKKPMEQALIKLTVKNLANLTPHPWYSAYHYSHPTPTERIAAIRQTEAHCVNTD